MEIISWKDAKASGLRTYYTGKPCKRGQLSCRRVDSRDCLCALCSEHRDIRKAGWYERNRPEITDRRRESYESRRDELTAKSRRYHAENRHKVAIRAKAYRERNRDALLLRKRAYRNENSAAVNARIREWREMNPGKLRGYAKSYAEKNPGKKRDSVVRRRASKDLRTPSWFGELDAFASVEAFALCGARATATGIEWHVDHIIPLRARKASGLHCAANLQVIPAQLNRKKGSRLWLTTADEWLEALGHCGLVACSQKAAR